MTVHTDGWAPTPPPDAINGDLEQVLAPVDTLRRAWEESIDRATGREFDEARQRSLRRHAIETGVIEQLYDIGWGVTEALVAEGLSASVAEREGGVDAGALAVIRSQFDALNHLAESVHDGQPLTSSFIRQLHQALCRTQSTYQATDPRGAIVHRPLHLGTWKTLPNHAVTEDGQQISFAPPEQVDAEIDRLVGWEADAGGLHPVVRAAWLHYAFVSIHPFDDGNGRVARALALLVLLRHHYAPLVVDRALRDLDAAGRADSAARLATALNERIHHLLTGLGSSLEEQFRGLDASARVRVFSAAPPDERARWWRAQIVRIARREDFHANVADGTWWCQLRLRVLGADLRYVAVVQKVGQGETGVLALTVFAESVPTQQDDSTAASPEPLLKESQGESVTLVHSDELDARWDEVHGVVDRTLAASIAEFAEGLG
ncbi:MAG: Fic family protein [Phycicoccus sp.]